MIDDTIGGSHTLPYMMTFVKDDNPRENPNRMIGMVVSQPEQSDVVSAPPARRCVSVHARTCADTSHAAVRT